MSAPRNDELPTAFLYLEDGDTVFRVHLDRPRMLIGSADDNDIVVRDQHITPHHAVIYYAGRHFVLSVVTARVGLVNGQVASGPRRLYNGDVIDLDGTVMTFVKVPRVSDTVLQLGVVSAGETPFFVLDNRPLVRIGHATGDVLLADEFVASPHCEVENFCAGTHYVVNLDDQRGTLLNGVRILQRSRLRDGDVLTMGATDVLVRLHPRCALPDPADLLPLRELARAAVRPGERDDAAAGDLASPAVRRRSGREVLESHEREEAARSGAAPPDFDVFDDDEGDRAWYLPGQAPPARPASMDPRLADVPAGGLTMLIPADGAGKPKRSRYYVPDDDSAPVPSERERETRQDIPVGGGGHDADG